MEIATKIVHKITDDINPQDVIATTYQMRNMYAQFADGFIGGLDIMNYIQHYKAMELAKKGDVVLDMCCGRGLMLPLLRYYKNNISKYIGVDIHKPNIKAQFKRSGIKKIDGLDYYPFDIEHIISNVAEMSNHIKDESVDYIIYTASIEHMQREDGAKSLREAWKVLKPGKKMFLSCPNTMDKKNPYDTQYAAHLYEWDLDELTKECKLIGFNIENTFGLYAKKRKFDKIMENESNEIREMYNKFKEYLPTPFLMSFFPTIFPQYADEVVLIVSKPE